MPIYYATGSRCKAFMWSVLSGVTEPIGGILGFAALQPVMTDMVFGVIFGMVGGSALGCGDRTATRACAVESRV